MRGKIPTFDAFICVKRIQVVASGLGCGKIVLRYLTFSASFWTSVLFMLAVCVALGVFILRLDWLGYNWPLALRDGALSNAPFAGVVSDAGIVLLLVAGLLAAYASLRTGRRPIAAISLFCLVFALDDGLMLHERLGPVEFIVFPLYAVGLVLVWRGFSRELGKRMIWPIALAFAAFVFSAVVDQLWLPFVQSTEIDLIRDHAGVGYALEDLPKAAGLALLATCAICESLLALRRSLKERDLPGID